MADDRPAALTSIRSFARTRVRPLLARYGLDGSARIQPAQVDDVAFPAGSLPAVADPASTSNDGDQLAML